jgi:hypothetical protein
MTKKDTAIACVPTENVQMTAATVNTPAPGFEEFGPEDQVLPRRRIVQPTTQDDATPGTFVDGLTGKEYQQIRAVVLTISKGRVMWSPELGNDPICKSDDSLMPSHVVDAPQSAICAERVNGRLVDVCPCAKWQDSDDKPGTQDPPRCKLTYRFLVVDRDEGAPFLISFHGSQLRTVRQFYSHARSLNCPMYALGVTMRLRKNQGAKGSYYTIEFGDYERLPQADVDAYASLYNALAKYRPETTYESERLGDAD